MSQFTIKLNYQDAPMGYVGIWGTGSCVMSSTPLVFEEYVDEYDQKKYFRVAQGEWKDYYLGHLGPGIMGAYEWESFSTCPWNFETVDGRRRLRSGLNGQVVSFCTQGEDCLSDHQPYVYAYNDFHRLVAYEEDA